MRRLATCVLSLLIGVNPGAQPRASRRRVTRSVIGFIKRAGHLERRGFDMRAPCVLVAGVVALNACSSNDSELVVQTVSEYGGTPIEGVRVRVNDLPWVTTDGRGMARFERVDPPFTVRAYQTMTGGSGAHRFDDVWELPGLEANPVVLQVDGSPGLPFGPPNHHASIAGAISGISGSGPLVRVVATTPVYGGGAAAAAGDGTFEIPFASWEGPSPRTFVLHAFESDSADPPAQYHGHGSVPVSVADPTGEGGAVTGAVVALGAVTETHVRGEVTVAAALAGGALRPILAIEFPDASSVSLVRDGAPRSPGPFDFAVPVVGAPTAMVGFTAVVAPSGPFAGDFRRVAIAQGVPVSVSFDLPDPASLVEPADGGLIGSGTVFRWGAAPGAGRYNLHVSCDQVEGAVTRHVSFRGIETTATEARLPSIEFVALAPGATCTWDVAWYDVSDSLVVGPVGLRRAYRSATSPQRTATVQ